MKDLILEICTAYEQGYGHGYDKRNLTNPYTQKTDGWEAWDYGYSEGSRRRFDHDVNNEAANAI